MTASDTFVVPSVAKSITFTADVVPDSVWDRQIPRTVLRWRWAPTFGTEIAIGSCTMVCTRSLSEPGIMYVDVRVNERELTASVQIQAEELLLVGVPDSVFPGEAIIYTASARFGSSISNGAWEWTGGVVPGDSLTVANCAPGTTTCTVDTFESGEMDFTALVQGVLMSAQVSSFVWPCPPDTSANPDSLLTDPEVLKGLWNTLKVGNADSSVNSLKRKEPWFDILRRDADSSHFVRIITDTVYATQCQSRPDIAVPPLGTTRVADGHAHVSSPMDTVYGCPDGQQFPGDSGMVFLKEDYGGSDQDTTAARQLGHSFYAVEKDSGFVFRLDPSGAVPGITNPNRWRRTRGVCVARW